MGADTGEPAVWDWHLLHNGHAKQKYRGHTAHTDPGLSGNCCHPVLFLGPKQQDMEERWMPSKRGVGGSYIPFPVLLGHRPDTTAIGRKTNHPGDKEDGGLW